MANSSQSGNILGYASGTQPGLVSTVAQTFAGKKTLDGGAAIKGDTSGTAIAAGYVGEKITWSSTPTSYTVTTSFANWPNANFTLTAGIWVVYLSVSYVMSCNASSDVAMDVQVVDGSSSIIAPLGLQARIANIAATTMAGSLAAFTLENLSTSKSYTIQARYRNVAGTGSATLYNGNPYTTMYGVRIA